MRLQRIFCKRCKRLSHLCLYLLLCYFRNVTAHKSSSHYALRCQLNKNDFSCRRNSLMSLLGWRILAGRLFQSHGPAAVKLQSPSRVSVRGTQHVSMSADRSRGVRDKLAVIYKICCSCIMQRLVDQEGHLELDST